MIARALLALHHARGQSPAPKGAPPMSFAGINYLAVIVAAIASFGLGFAWYATLGKRWMAALGMSREELLPGGRHPWSTLVLTFIAELVMAWMLAGLLGHLGTIDIRTGLISAISLWVGFVATVMLVDHRFQRARWALSLIDGGHWLGVLLLQGAVLGVFGL